MGAFSWYDIAVSVLRAIAHSKPNSGLAMKELTSNLSGRIVDPSTANATDQLHLLLGSECIHPFCLNPRSWMSSERTLVKRKAIRLEDCCINDLEGGPCCLVVYLEDCYHPHGCQRKSPGCPFAKFRAVGCYGDDTLISKAVCQFVCARRHD